MIVADIVRRSAPSVREHTVLTVAADALVESGLGSLPVLDADGLLTGVVSEGDLLRFVVGTRHEPAGSPRTVSAAYRQDAYRHVVADVMTRNPVTATEPLPVEEVARLFVGCRGGCAVVRLGRLVGVVTRTDVVHALVGSDRLTGRADPGRPPTFLATRLTGRCPNQESCPVRPVWRSAQEQPAAAHRGSVGGMRPRPPVGRRRPGPGRRG